MRQLRAGAATPSLAANPTGPAPKASAGAYSFSKLCCPQVQHSVPPSHTHSHVPPSHTRSLVPHSHMHSRTHLCLTHGAVRRVSICAVCGAGLFMAAGLTGGGWQVRHEWRQVQLPPSVAPSAASPVDLGQDDIEEDEQLAFFNTKVVEMVDELARRSLTIQLLSNALCMR